jgi:hypothetical protein
MFYGLVVPAKKETKVEGSNTNLIHVSSIALHSKTPGSTNVFLKKNNERFLVAVLDSQRQAQVALDFYILSSDNVSFFSESGEVHVVGYYEPSEADLALAPKNKVSKAQPVEVPRKKSNISKEDDLDELDIKPKGPVKAAPVVNQKAPAIVQKFEVRETTQPAKVVALNLPKPSVHQPKVVPAPVPKKQATQDEDLEELDDEDLEGLDEEDLENLDDEEEDEEGDEDDEDLEDEEDDEEDEEDEEEDEEEDTESKPRKNVGKRNAVIEDDDEEEEEGDDEDEPLQKRPQRGASSDRPSNNRGFVQNNFRGDRGSRGGDRGFRGGSRGFRGDSRGSVDRRGGFRGGDRDGGDRRGGFRGGDRRGGFRGGDRDGGDRRGGFRGGDRDGGDRRGGFRGGRGGSRGGSGFRGGRGGSRGGSRGGFRGGRGRGSR